MITIVPDRAHARSLLSEGLFDRLCRRITLDDGADRAFAERIMDQALAFLAACGRFPGNKLAPSKPVDIGWHTFILYTREYAEFCERVAAGSSTTYRRTRRAHRSTRKTRRVFGTPRWTRSGAPATSSTPNSGSPTPNSCGSCHEDGNCAASGKDGNENTDTRTT